MANGTIEFPKSGMTADASYIRAKIDWESTPDVEANESDVTAKLYVKIDNDAITLTYPTGGTWHWELEVNGEHIYGVTSVFVLTDWVLLGTKTIKDIAHNSEGDKSISMYGSVTGPSGTSFQGRMSTGSGTADLGNIPKASTITSAAAVTLGGKCSVKWTPASASFRYKLKFSLGEWSYTTDEIHPNKTSAHTYNGYIIPIEVANQITDSKTATMTVSLYTYSDIGATEQIGDVSTETFTVTVPDTSNTRPDIMVGVAPVHELPDAFAGLYIQGKSKVRVIVNAYGRYGAEIASHTAKVEGKEYTGKNITSDYLMNYGEVSVSGTAVDSRGYSSTKKTVIAVIPYTKPSILPVDGEKAVVASRCDEDGNLVDNGTYLKIKAKRRYSPVESGGEQHNFCKIQYRYKPASAESYSEWVTILEGNNLTSDEVGSDPLLGGVLSATSTYMVEIRVMDDVGETGSTTIYVPTATVYMHRTKNAMAIGKYVERENLLDVAWDAHFRGEVLIGDSGMTLKEFILAVISEGG